MKSVHQLVREMWDRDDGTPLQFLAAAFTFALMFGLIFWALFTLAPKP